MTGGENGVLDEENTQYVFFVRHGESRWNAAQAGANIFKMFRENDHGLTEKGRQQCENLRACIENTRVEIETGSKSGDSSPVTFLKHHEATIDETYYKRLLKPIALYSSPFTRAVETALICFGSVIQTSGELVLLPDAREQRNSLLSADAAGIEIGERIPKRVYKELNELYNKATTVSKYSIEQLTSPKIDCSKVQQRWWNSRMEPEGEVKARQAALVQLLRAQGTGSSTVVVGHSHFFRRFFRDHMSTSVKKSCPGIADSLQMHVIPPCGIVGLKLKFDDGGGCIREAFPLFDTPLRTAEKKEPSYILRLCFWTLHRIQGALRKHSLLLPCTILLFACALAIGYNTMFPESSADSMRTFLIVVTMSMFPLAYVDACISSCREPMAFCDKFGIQVVLMHSIFLTLRATAQQLRGEFDIFNNYQNILGSIASYTVLVIGFHDQIADVRHYRAVVILYLLAVIAALVTVKFSPDLEFDFVQVTQIVSDYGEVLAFVPAAWVTFRERKKDVFGRVTSEALKRRTLSLSFFTIGFYILEDIVTLLLTAMSSRVESMAHLLHFALLVDFGVYVMSSAFIPNDNRGTMLTRFGEAFMMV